VALAGNGSLIGKLKLPYQLTGAQRRVIEEIRGDMAQTGPMLPLPQGDVGCGNTSVASVNSALQRARATLESLEIQDAETLLPTDDEQRALLDRYVDAFERYDMESLTSLLREDATWSMPPYEMWLQTHDDIRAWCLGPGIGCRGSKLIALEANGMPAFGQYKPGPQGGLEPWSLQVLEVADGRIIGISFFLDTGRLFPQFGLPPRLDG